MKLYTEDHEVLTTSDRESKFTITASAHAFRILSDGLYQHKIAAIIRELSCNAYDSHVQAGKVDEPFRVVLPNTLHPYFEIEDFGVGLDDDEVRSIYTSYFTSTKSQSNDVVGAFGLGSKTPFSYTDSFDIIARKDGVERIYSAYIGSEGSPCVNLISEKQTVEGNGVRITVPVKGEDYKEFQGEASFILSFFKTKPTVDLADFEFFLPEIAKELEENGIAATNYSSYNSPSKCYRDSIYIVMGSVCYPYDSYALLESLDGQYKQYYNNVIAKSYNTKVFIKYDIGDLDVAASRESLSIDERTKQKLSESLETKIRDLMRIDFDTLNQLEHPVEALDYVGSKYGHGALTYAMFDFKGQNLNDLSQLYIFKRLEKIKDMHCYVYGKTGWGTPKAEKLSDGLRYINLVNKDKIIGVYVEPGQKATGLIGESRDLARASQRTLVLGFGKPMTQRQRDAIARVIGKEIEWLDLTELRKKSAALKPSKSKVASPATKILSTEVSAPRWDITQKNSKYILRERFDLALIDNVYHVEEALLSEKSIRVKLKDGSIYVSRHDLFKYAKMLGEDFTVVSMNTMTRNKLESRGSIDISNLIERIIDKGKSYVLFRTMKEDMTSYYNKNIFKIDDDEFVFCDEGIQFLENIEAEKVKEDLQGLRRLIDDFDKNSIKEYENLLGHVSSLRTVLDDRYRNEISKMCEDVKFHMDSITNIVNTSYPMIAVKFWNADIDNKDVLKEYVKMVDNSEDDVVQSLKVA